jgi:hypothetical protein
MNTKAPSASRCLLALAIALQAHTASAWDGQATGKIATIEATGLGNYAFRIWLGGAPVMCSGGHHWAYVDGTNSNYKVLVSTLLMARARGDSVTAFTLNDASGNNFCRIEHIATGD